MVWFALETGDSLDLFSDAITSELSLPNGHGADLVVGERNLGGKTCNLN